MPTPTRSVRAMTATRGAALLALVGLGACAWANDPWAAPSGFYDAVTGTGATLKSQLGSRMTSGHIQRNYGDFRYASPLFDADPAVPGRILLAYNRASVSGAWDNGGTWNREHVWPDSRQPGSASNSSTGNLGDHHALRPCNPSINSSRGNKPFGFTTSFGAFGSVGTHYFPGDTDKGDIARSLFYSDTRWGPSLGLSLVNGTPSGNQMGDLASFIAWNYLDAPDEFERRRNHVVFSQAHNPSYYTNNRNAFIDRPWYVWSVYVDQMNDTQLSVADPDANGASAAQIDLAAYVGTPAPLQTVSVLKTGFDGTYFSVTVTGDAVSPQEGPYNAFPLVTGTGVDFADIEVGLTAPPFSGIAVGTVVIDNLDVTTGGGPGAGANDADDVVTLTLTVLDRSEGSFDASADVDALAHAFGSVPAGGGEAEFFFNIHNLEPTPGLTGSLWITGVSGIGDTGVLSLEPAVESVVQAGDFVVWRAVLDDTAPGTFEATYTIQVADDPSVLGSISGPSLVVHLTGTVTGGCPADLTGDGELTLDDLDAFIVAFLSADLAADLTGDGVINLDDLDTFIASFLAGCP